MKILLLGKGKSIFYIKKYLKSKNVDYIQAVYENELDKNLNDITCRSSRYYNAMATEEGNCIKPEKNLETIWKEADKEQAINLIKSTESSDADKQIEELKEEDYIFKMDWAETFFNSQEPDTKPYPNEGIIARQKAQDLEGDGPDTLEDTLGWVLTDIIPPLLSDEA